MKIPSLFALSTAFASLCFLATAQAQTPTPIAEWTFPTGTSADLTSNIGGYTLSPRSDGQGNAATFVPGAMSIDQYSGYYATGINSTAFPEMLNGATVFARMKFPATLTSGGGYFFMGLFGATSPASWSQMDLTAWTTSGANVGVYGNTNANAPGGNTGGTMPTGGQYFTLGLTAAAGTDQNGFPNSGDTQINLYINGVFINSVALTGATLENFESLAIGQLGAGSGVSPMTFSNLQVFDSTLNAAQMSALNTAVTSPVPEPSSTALLLVCGGIGMLLIGAKRRRTLA